MMVANFISSQAPDSKGLAVAISTQATDYINSITYPDGRGIRKPKNERALSTQLHKRKTEVCFTSHHAKKF